MTQDYKVRRAAKHAAQKAARRLATSQTAGTIDGSFEDWKSTPLRDAAHEIGHGALSVPESEWHLALGSYNQCPACEGLPPMDTHGLVLAAHRRDLTRGGALSYELHPFEHLYYVLAGGAAEAACFSDEPMPFQVYEGNPNPLPYGMDDDFHELRSMVPSLLRVAHLAYRDLYLLFLPHRAVLLSYAEKLVEIGVLCSSEIRFPFDTAGIRFNGLEGVDPAHPAHMAGKCHRCGQSTTAWGLCMDCRFRKE
jgi:hypothetical protein